MRWMKLSLGPCKIIETVGIKQKPAQRRQGCARSTSDFRKACRSSLHPQPPHSHGFRINPRTCFEGPFGEVIRATGSMARANPFRFSTKYQDDESDLVYYGYRYYGASAGRWLSRDPIAEAGFTMLRQGRKNRRVEDEHPYLFGRNDPFRYFDVHGLSVADVGNMYATFVEKLTVMCICHMSCPEIGWLQNLPTAPYYGCTKQTEYMEDVLDKMHFEDGWDITVNYDTSNPIFHHNSVRVKPKNPDDPVVDIDPWKGCFSVTWPKGSTQKDFKRCFSCKELLKGPKKSL